MRLILLVVLLFSPQVGQRAGDLDERVNEAIRKLANGNTSELVIPRYDDPSQAAVAFSSRIAPIGDDRARKKLVTFSAELERHALRAARQPCRSSNLELAQLWVSIVEADASSAVRGAAARNLRDLFSPEVLDAYSGPIRNATQRARHQEVFLLYGVLPSNDPNSVLKLIRPLRESQDVDRLVVDSILARYGDRKAEQRLLTQASKFSKGGLVRASRVFDALAYVETETIKQAVARGLRSETVIELAGGGKIPQRNSYARSLVRMMRDEGDFPIRSEGLAYSRAELDRIEEWCTRHLGVQFPKEKGEHLVPVPHIEPAPRRAVP